MSDRVIRFLGNNEITVLVSGEEAGGAYCVMELVTQPGETIVVPSGVQHRFAGAGDLPSRMLTVGPAEFEKFFRALAAAWAGPYDRERTPAAVGPVFEAFGMRLVAQG